MFINRKLKRLFIFGIAFTTIGVLINYEWKIRHGYCFAEGRYVSEAEYSEGISNELARWLDTSSAESQLNHVNGVIENINSKYFLDHNSNCCGEIFNENSRAVKTRYGRYVYSKEVEFKYSAESNGVATATVEIEPCGKGFLVSYVDKKN